MENKVHFKLHKVKKQWVTIAVSGLALGASLIGVGVSADEQAANQVTSANTPESVNQNPDLVVTETTTTTSKAEDEATAKSSDTSATVTANNQPVLKENQASSTYNLASGETRTATSSSEVANTATDVNSQAPEAVETTVISGGQFKSDAEGNWYYLKDGKNLTGAQNVDHFDLYFHEDGKQAKGEIITENGQSFYYDKANGRKVTNTSININGQAYTADAQGRLTAVLPETNKHNQFIEDNNHNWYYLGKDGKPVTGVQTIDGFNLYFHEDGRQAKNEIVTINGDSYYFDKDNGRRVTGHQALDNVNHKYFGFYYFDKDGKMVKDDFITENGNLYYFDATGYQPDSVFVSDKSGNWYYFDNYKATKGFSAPFGFRTEFLDRSQADYKTSVQNLNGQQYYFDPKTGIMVTNRYVSDDKGNWYYFGKDGKALHGFQTVDGSLHYFNDSGQQVKGDFLYYDNEIYYFDKDNGNLVTNQFVNRDNSWYYFGADGKAVSGFQTINGQNLYFHEYGVQAKGQLVTIDGKTYYFDPNTGDKWVNRSLILNGTVYNFDSNGMATLKTAQTSNRNQFVQGSDQEWYYYDANCKKVTGFQTINKELYYFNDKGQQVRGAIFNLGDNQYFANNETGAVLRNAFYHDTSTDHYGDFSEKIYYAGNDGAFKTGWFEVDGNRYYGSDYSDNGTSKGRLYTGVVNSQLFSPDGKLLTNGLYPEFKRTGENDYELKEVYITDADGKIKEGPYQYDGKILGSKYSSVRQSQWSTIDQWDILNGHLYHFNSTPMTFTAPNGQKVTTNIAIATTNKSLTYRGVTFNFDAKGIDAAKEKAIHFDQLQTDPSGTSYLYKNGQKVTGLKTFDGVSYYFYDDGHQAKGTEVAINNNIYQFDQLTGIMTRNAFSKSYNYEGSPRFPYYPTRYYGKDGAALTGWQTIDGKDYYFRDSGNLETGRFVIGDRAYNADDNGVVADRKGEPAYRNRIVYDKGDNYYYNDKGEKVTGFQEVDGKVLYFDAEGKQVLGRFVTVDNYTYYFDPKTGERYSNRSVPIDGKLYTFDKDGHVVS